MKRLLSTLALLSAITIAVAAAETYQGYYQKARQEAHQGNVKGARATLQQALTVAQTDAQKSKVLLDIAQLDKKEKNNLQARQAWLQVVALQGAPKENKQVALFALGGSYLDEDNFVQARQYLSQVVADKSANQFLQESSQLGIVSSFHGQRQYEEARQEARKVVDNPNATLTSRLIAQQQIAETYVSQNQLPQARAELTQAEQLVSSLPIQQAAVRLRIVRLYAQENNAEEALKSLNSFGSMMTLRAKKALDKKDYATARESFSAILALRNGYDAKGSNRSPQTIGLLLVIGQMYQFEGNYPKAKEMYYSVVAVNPEANGISKEDAVTIRTLQQSARLDIARALVSQGNSAEAKKAYVALLNTPDLYPAYKKGAEGDLAKLK